MVSSEVLSSWLSPCTVPWQDITSRLLAQQKSTAELEQHIRACKEKRRALKDTLQELELKHAKLKFHQPPSAIRCCHGLGTQPDADALGSIDTFSYHLGTGMSMSQ